MTNAACNVVTHAVSNAVRRNVQNQNQNQTVVTAIRCSPVADESIHRYGLLDATEHKRMSGYAARFGGVR